MSAVSRPQLRELTMNWLIARRQEILAAVQGLDIRPVRTPQPSGGDLCKPGTPLLSLSRRAHHQCTPTPRRRSAGKPPGAGRALDRAPTHPASRQALAASRARSASAPGGAARRPSLAFKRAYPRLYWCAFATPRAHQRRSAEGALQEGGSRLGSVGSPIRLRGLRGIHIDS